MRVLSEREREILRLRFEEDLTQAEIGERVGVSPDARLAHHPPGDQPPARRGRSASALTAPRSTLPPMEHWDLRTLDVEPHQPKILHSARGEARSILINLPAGEELQEHEVHERAYVVVIDGEVDLARAHGGAGLAAVFDPHERHAVQGPQRRAAAARARAVAGRRTSWSTGLMAEITFQNIWKRYPDGFEAVKDMNLEIGDGEFMILVGPSGCGKSTALRMVAGLEEITDGELIIGGERVNELAPRDRDIAMVFQNYALYPHMTVRENMGFALKLAKVDKSEIEAQGPQGGRDPRAQRPPGPQAGEPLRRPAPARGDGPRDRARPEGVPDGRAAVQPRRQAARADAHRRWRASSTSSARRCSTSPTTRPRR